MQNLSVQAILGLSLVVAALLVYIPFVPVAYARTQIGMQALATPRAFVEKLPPYAQRATWAHKNAFEAFSLFAAAVLLALVTGAEGTWVMGAAIAHIIARLFYPLFYIANIPAGRSLMFAVGSLSTFTLFALSLQTLL